MNIDDELLTPLETDSSEIANFIAIYNKAKLNMYVEKDEQYGSSWCNDGVLSAWFNLKRKIDRMLKQYALGKLFNWKKETVWLDKKIKTETILDTFMDMDNYSMLYVSFMFFKIDTKSQFEIFCEKIEGIEAFYTFDEESKKVIRLKNYTK